MDETPNQPVHEEKSQKTSIGPMAAIVVLVILFIIGGIYFFIQQEMKLHQTPLNEQGSA